jgi:hypothetical protein
MMNRLLLLAIVVLVASLQMSGAAAATDTDSRFFGRAHLFDSQEEAPDGSYVRARVAGEICAGVAVAPKNIAGETKQSYDITLPAGTCGSEDAVVEFEWYRSDPAIATTCNQNGTWHAGDQRLDLICGQESTFSAAWIVRNTTGETQRALQVFPRVVVGNFSAGGPDGCGNAIVHGGSTSGSPVLVTHAEAIFSEPCIAPDAEVRVGLGTDCPCRSELEVVKVVWLPGEPLFNANVDCDFDVDAADALRDLLSAAETSSAEVADCPDVGGDDYNPLTGAHIWGDVDCDQHVTGADVVAIMRVAIGVPSGIAADCVR